MAKIIKKIKMKQQDETMSNYIPIGAEASNVNVDGESVENKLNKTPYYYDSVADMKADTKLKAGDMAITLGYYEPNDGGGAEYIIKTTAVADGYSIHKLANDNFAELIIKNCLYSSQVGVSESLEDNSGPLNHFLLRAATLGKTNLQAGQYRITHPLTMYLSSSIDINGQVDILDYIEDDTVTINVTKLSDEEDSSGRPYSNTILGASNGVLRIRNLTSYENYSNKIGMEIGSAQYSTNGIIKNINFRGRYAEALRINTDNVYWLKMQDMGYTGAEIGLHVQGETLSNSGEKIVIDRNCWTRCNCSIRIDQSFNMIFTDCAWDFVSCCFYATEIVEIICDRCHFEGIGDRYSNQITAYENFAGIFKARDILLDYQRTYLKISNSHILSSYRDNFTYKIFSGQSLYVTLENNVFYTLSNHEAICAIDDNFDYAWSTNDDIREVHIDNCHGEYNGLYQNFYLKRDNLIDGFLEEENTYQQISTTSAMQDALILNMKNFELLGTSSLAQGTKISIETLNGAKKAIKIIPPYKGGASNVILRTKRKFDLDTIPKLFILGYTKAFLEETHMKINLAFFDENNNYISKRDNIWNNFGTKNIEHWFTSVRDGKTRLNNNNFEAIIPPKNAAYYKIDFYMFVTNAATEVQPSLYTCFYVNY